MIRVRSKMVYDTQFGKRYAVFFRVVNIRIQVDTCALFSPGVTPCVGAVIRASCVAHTQNIALARQSRCGGRCE